MVFVYGEDTHARPLMCKRLEGLGGGEPDFSSLRSQNGPRRDGTVANTKGTHAGVPFVLACVDKK